MQIKPELQIPEEKAVTGERASELAVAVLLALKQLGVVPEKAPSINDYIRPDTVLTGDAKAMWLNKWQPSACTCAVCLDMYHVNDTKGRLTGKGIHWKCASCGKVSDMKSRPSMVYVKHVGQRADPTGYQFCSAACGATSPRDGRGELISYDAIGRPSRV